MAEGLSDRAATVAATKRTTELPSTWRVYRKEFLLDSRYIHRRQAVERYEAVYLGRIEERDVRFDEDLSRSRPYELWVRRWNLSGEFKHETHALEHARLQDVPVEVVPRNSRAEHTLRNYGVAKLAT